MNREDIRLVSRYSNWSERGIKMELRENVYASPHQWRKFLHFLVGVLYAVFGQIYQTGANT